MYHFIQFLHLAAAILWMGGMAFAVLALRRPLTDQLEPPARLQLLGAVLSRFFVVVGISIAVLLFTGVFMFITRGPATAPLGVHTMTAVGLVMMFIFGHLYFSPYRRLRAAVAAGDWSEAGNRAGQITLLVKINLGLGWLAIAAVMLWR